MNDATPFRGLDDQTRQLLTEKMCIRHFSKGQRIFSEGDPTNGLYAVIDGSVELSVSIGSKDHRTLASIEAGGIFGEMAALDGRSRSATAEAETDCWIGEICRDDLLWVLRHSPGFTAWLLRLVSERHRDFTTRYVDETLQSERLKLLGTLVRSIVHDFKTPLSTINLAANLAGKDSMPAGKRTQLCDQIGRQVQRLDGMTNELLELSRCSNAPQQLLPEDFDGFLAPLLAEMKPQLTAKGISLIEAPPSAPVSSPVLVNARRLSQVFYNLLDNAADALPSGGRITVRWWERENMLQMEVEDSGSGVADAIADSLFKPFITHNKPRGTGLGLSICARIIEDHGGTIEAARSAAGGAVFRFTVPLWSGSGRK